MCGRFVRTSSTHRFAALLGAAVAIDVKPSYNIAPGSALLVARATADAGRELVTMKWGLVPAWSAEPKTPYSTINARAETVADKPVFRSAFKHRRCLIAADGFYEWAVGPDGQKQPYFIRLKTGEPFAFAGLWEHWARADQALDSCTLVVTAANAWMKPIHERMPVIVRPEHYERWLDPAIDTRDPLESLLTPCADDLLERDAVSRLVNSPHNDGRDLIEPLAEGK
jgi:putative SOS response-associated peptidase YedK